MDEKERSLRNEKLKTNRASETEEKRKEMLRIRRQNKKTENHEKRHLATIKILKRGDDNELESSLRLEKVVTSKLLRLSMEKEEQDWRMMQYQTAQVGHGDGRRKKIKTGEDGSYHSAHVGPD